MCGEERNGEWMRGRWQACVHVRLKGLMPCDIGSGCFPSASLCENVLFMPFFLKCLHSVSFSIMHFCGPCLWDLQGT